MKRKRIIPTLLLKDNVLVKGVKFANHIYVANAINAVRIFSHHEVDEIAMLSIDGKVSIDFLNDIASECFIPFTVGGGIRTLQHATEIIKAGAEKVILNTAIYHQRNIITEISSRFGNQAVVACVDVRKEDSNYCVYSENGRKKEKLSFSDTVDMVIECGAGEIMIQSIDREGTASGPDLEILKEVSRVPVPIAISGGTSGIDDIIRAFQAGADAVCIGTMFLFRNNERKSILINVPNRKSIDLWNVHVV